MRMGTRSLVGVAATLVMGLAMAGCGDDGGSPGGGGADDGPAAPDGSYASETGPNDEAVSFEVEDGTITHLEGKVYGDCGGTTTSESVESDVEIPIEDDAVDYSSGANGATATMTGSFDDGTFEGTFTYTRAGSACPSEPYDFTASAD